MSSCVAPWGHCGSAETVQVAVTRPKKSAASMQVRRPTMRTRAAYMRATDMADTVAAENTPGAQLQPASVRFHSA